LAQIPALNAFLSSCPLAAADLCTAKGSFARAFGRHGQTTFA
jgi:hypothetical protein